MKTLILQIPNVPDDTATLPVLEPNIPLYTKQQQQLVMKELTIKIIRLTETELRAHQKSKRVMTTPKQRGITTVTK